MAFDPNKHIIKMSGKDYLEVKWRILWFKDTYAERAAINTDVISFDPLVVKATVLVDGVIVATGHGSANAGERKVIWSGRELEKAETAAIGRALAHAGFGTQFTGENESTPADSPVDRKPSPRPAPVQRQAVQSQPAGNETTPPVTDPGPFKPTKRDLAYEATSMRHNYGARKHFDNLMELLQREDKVHVDMSVDELVAVIDAHYAAKALPEASGQ